MAASPSADEPIEAAQTTAPYFQFDTRLDYYMKLAEEPDLPNDTYGSESNDHPAVPSALVRPSPLSFIGAAQGISGSPGRPAPAQLGPNLTSQAGMLQMMPGGRRSYFGPTSYLNFFPNPLTFWNPIAVKSKETYLGASRLLMAPEKSAVEDHLVDCFFTYDNLFLDFLDSSIYLRDKARFESGQETLLYSPALGYAVLAVGLLYSLETDSTALFDSSEDFASLARRFLHDELEAPSVSTVLTLIVLCSLSAAEALDDQGWFYSGTALRLISGLGLDQDGALSYPLENKSTLQSMQHSIVKGAVCLDTIWRSWCGRISGLTYTSIPDLQPEDNSRHGHREPACAAVSCFITLGLIHRNMLWQLAQRQGNVDQVQTALERWKESCPEPADQTDHRISALTIQSLMHCHGITIQLHRLWLDTGRLGYHSSTTMYTSSPAKCIESANEISRLQQLFRQRHGFRRLQPLSIHPMLASSLINVQDLVGSAAQSKEAKQVRQNILRSIQGFGEIAETMNVGSRALEIVMAAQRDWQGRLP